MRNIFRTIIDHEEQRIIVKARAARFRAALVEIDCALARMPVGPERQQLQAHATALLMAAPLITPEPPE